MNVNETKLSYWKYINRTLWACYFGCFLPTQDVLLMHTSDRKSLSFCCHATLLKNSQNKRLCTTLELLIRLWHCVKYEYTIVSYIHRLTEVFIIFVYVVCDEREYCVLRTMNLKPNHILNWIIYSILCAG